MEDNQAPDGIRPHARSKLAKLAIAMAVLGVVLLAAVLGIGAFSTYLRPTPTPELVLRIEAERTSLQSSEPDASPASDTGTAPSQSGTLEPTTTTADQRTPAEPLFPLYTGLTPEQTLERERINSVFQQCADGFAECAHWDNGLTYWERKKKLSDLLARQQANLDALSRQFDVEDKRRLQLHDLEDPEAYQRYRQILERYNGLVRLYDELSLENAIRNRQWYDAACRSKSNSDMIYYFRQVETTDFEKFAWITGGLMDRGYKSLRRSNRLLERFLP